MLGVQLPIILAVFEYGIILAMRKQDQKTLRSNVIKVTKVMPPTIKQKNEFEKQLDKWTFFGCFLFIILFNLVYWTMAQKIKDMQ